MHKTPSIQVKPRIRGFFRLRATKLDGTVRELTGWFPNLITDAGLNRIGTGPVGTCCQVGTGTAAPAVSDTSLDAYLAGTNAITSSVDSSPSVEPYYGSSVRTYRFNVGVAAGNLAEVAIGWTTTTGNIFSRARILDIAEAPTVITVLSDEVLDVDYELRLYPPLVDVEQTIVSDAVSYDLVTRAASVTNWGWYAGSLLTNGICWTGPGGTTFVVYGGPIGTIVQNPSGTAAFGSSAQCTLAAYVNNSLTRRFILTLPIIYGNVAGGMGALWVGTSMGGYQIGSTPKIPKDATKTLAFNFDVSWDRRIL